MLANETIIVHIGEVDETTKPIICSNKEIYDNLDSSVQLSESLSALTVPSSEDASESACPPSLEQDALDSSCTSNSQTIIRSSSPEAINSDTKDLPNRTRPRRRPKVSVTTAEDQGRGRRTRMPRQTSKRRTNPPSLPSSTEEAVARAKERVRQRRLQIETAVENGEVLDDPYWRFYYNKISTSPKIMSNTVEE